MLAASGASNCASCRQIDLLQGINDEQRYQSAYAAQLAEQQLAATRQAQESQRQAEQARLDHQVRVAYANWQQTPNGKFHDEWMAQARTHMQTLTDWDASVQAALAQDIADSDAKAHDSLPAEQLRAAPFPAKVGIGAGVLIFVLLYMGRPVAAFLIGAAVLGVYLYMSNGPSRARRTAATTARAGYLGFEHVGSGALAWTDPSVSDYNQSIAGFMQDAPRTLPSPASHPPLFYPRAKVEPNYGTHVHRVLSQYPAGVTVWPRTS